MSRFPRIRRKWLVALSVAAVGAGALVGYGAFVGFGNAYPDSLFAKVPATHPRTVAIREEPSKEDVEAFKVYEAEQETKIKYLRVMGPYPNATKEERAALDALYANKYTRARLAAETILRDNPKSFPAMYVRAAALFRGDSAPAAALHQLQHLRRELEAVGRENPANFIAREWYLRALQVENDCLEALGRDAEALRCVELLEQTYEPMPWMKTWSLIRLKQYDAAEETVTATEQSGRWTKRVGNDRPTLECERLRRKQTYDGYRRYTELNPDGRIAWINFGLAAQRYFSFAEAEEAYLKSAKYATSTATSSSYTDLCGLYVQQGRFAEALDALQKAKQQRTKRDPATWQYDQGNLDLQLANFLQQLGMSTAAERLARRAYEQPNRTGTTSENGDLFKIKNALLLTEVLRSLLAEMQENDIAASQSMAQQGSRRLLEFELWHLEKVVLKLLNDDFLMRGFRPQLDLAGEQLIQVLPAGTALAAIAQAKQAEDHPAAAPYFAASTAEVHHRAGRRAAALTFAREALEKLPVDGEKLARCRMQTIAAVAELDAGRIAEALPLFDSVMGTCPALLRSLGAAIPVHFTSDDSPLSKKLEALLARSPRLSMNPAGFRLNARVAAGKLTIQLLRLTNAAHLEITIPLADGDDDATIRDAVEKFHQRLCVSSLVLDQTTINGLAGMPRVSVERDAIGKEIEELVKLSKQKRN